MDSSLLKQLAGVFLIESNNTSLPIATTLAVFMMPNMFYTWELSTDTQSMSGSFLAIPQWLGFQDRSAVIGSPSVAMARSRTILAPLVTLACHLEPWPVRRGDDAWGGKLSFVDVISINSYRTYIKPRKSWLERSPSWAYHIPKKYADWHRVDLIEPPWEYHGKVRGFASQDWSEGKFHRDTFEDCWFDRNFPKTMLFQNVSRFNANTMADPMHSSGNSSINQPTFEETWFPTKHHIICSLPDRE